MEELARRRHLVLDEAGAVVMAHPFSAVPLGFSVMGRRTLWWGGCCWDSFAMAHLLTTSPTCSWPRRARDAAGPAPGRRPGGTARGRLVAHFLVPVAHMWDDVVHTCSNQRLFCSEACLDTWLDEHGYERGYVMDLDTLWRLASRWYEGRLVRGYVRREPSAAAGYLRSVGLTGPFWE